MKKQLGRFLLSLSAVVVLLGLVTTGCNDSGGGKAGGNPIKVGEFASLTGKEATFGVSSHEGTLLAIEELNKAGGLFGRQFELLTEDDLSKAGEPATVVNKLISRDGVVAILGPSRQRRPPACPQEYRRDS